MSSERRASSSELAYFREIERVFIQLRGSPLLLSPTDYQIASAWHEEGVPLELIRATLEQIFVRRMERGAKNPVQSLRYCRKAVESAWGSWSEMISTGVRSDRPALAIEARLEALAESIPSRPQPMVIAAERIRNFVGDAQEVEARLAELDEELLSALIADLEPDQSQGIHAEVDEAMGRLSGRFQENQRQEVRERLFRQTTRRRFGLPVLSLFAPEASLKS